MEGWRAHAGQFGKQGALEALEITFWDVNAFPFGLPGRSGLAPFDGGAGFGRRFLVHLALGFDEVVVAGGRADKEVRQVKGEADALRKIVNAERLRAGVLGERGDIGCTVALLDKSGFQGAVAGDEVEDGARGLVDRAAFADRDLEWFPG